MVFCLGNGLRAVSASATYCFISYSITSKCIQASTKDMYISKPKRLITLSITLIYNNIFPPLNQVPAFTDEALTSLTISKCYLGWLNNALFMKTTFVLIIGSGF